MINIIAIVIINTDKFSFFKISFKNMFVDLKKTRIIES